MKNWDTCYRGGVQGALRASTGKHQVGIIKKGCLGFKLKDKNRVPGTACLQEERPGERYFWQREQQEQGTED